MLLSVLLTITSLCVLKLTFEVSKVLSGNNPPHPYTDMDAGLL